MSPEVRWLLKEMGEWEVGHAERVAVYATATAYRLGLTGEGLVRIRVAAEAHDVGKHPILRANPYAGAAELVSHPGLAAAILVDFVPQVLTAILHHHERLDGSGYPSGLVGPEISLGGQIVGVAEWFDVAHHGSPFSKARSLEEVRSELSAHTGRWFDDRVIDALLEVQRVIQPVGT